VSGQAAGFLQMTGEAYWPMVCSPCWGSGKERNGGHSDFKTVHGWFSLVYVVSINTSELVSMELKRETQAKRLNLTKACKFADLQ